ncbi:LuxS/MPP-like metallohydrolase [Epithele typhae]|uniref:LuxS/MPP-like metallohydrolase n=1 Tax=Epithele typhae TaxID=378194 RepID=UPI0020079509|nr:LuxS/MPP-like metallohydrolase [Epithele typhae]KAH9911302.1 LuxS/MPP-like metallohydrolase [Epithele typhae]
MVEIHDLTQRQVGRRYRELEAEPASSVTLLVKAGSRYETKPGLARVLKDYAFKSTDKRSTPGAIREADSLCGAVLSSSLSREHPSVTADFLEAVLVDVPASPLASPKPTGYELSEWVTPTCEAETAVSLAFRAGLGNSLFGPAHTHVTAEDVQAFAASAFTAGDVAVVGSGIDAGPLEQLLNKSLGKLSPSSATSSAGASKDFGGESRFAADGPQTVFIGFGEQGASAPGLAVLPAHLDPSPAVKWTKGTSPLEAAATPTASVRIIILLYSTDATLFCVLVRGATAAEVTAAGSAAVAALKAAGCLGAEELQNAVVNANFNAAASSFDYQVRGLFPSVYVCVLSTSRFLFSPLYLPVTHAHAMHVSRAASALLKSKPTFVAVGDIASLGATIDHSHCQ